MAKENLKDFLAFLDNERRTSRRPAQEVHEQSQDHTSRPLRGLKRRSSDDDEPQPKRRAAAHERDASPEPQRRKRGRSSDEQEDEGQPAQKKRVRTILIEPQPVKKSAEFQACMSDLYSIEFQAPLAQRWPVPVEVDMLRHFCERHRVPLLSLERVHELLGERAQEMIGHGSFGHAFRNTRGDLVMKCASNLFAFRTLVMEAKFMTLFSGCPGFQRVEGVCPENMCLVTKYAGPTLKQVALPAAHRLAVVEVVCRVLQNMHAEGFAHNHVKAANVCVSDSQEVTLIDFGLTMTFGCFPRLAIKWGKRLTYAPEICNSKAGICSRASDSYSVGKLLSAVLPGLETPEPARRWVAGSQLRTPNQRPYLAELLQVLGAHKGSN
ncbi:putative receptor-interacting serine/threonine-protein kinase 3-like [Penaeus vannamei]|uniref:Putative receptor-interacting serine/threonine-protein kinase 3-like n=1 Tax=Penaeus vannamei TaxID=6689 RepID=A0A3R7ML82_PENVA|nr:putative receptor-interacting serine/threonine-protein kinase 3-like [Penaeus vannamei]